jgi:hypothetical protein
MGDGSVRGLSFGIDRGVMQNLIRPADGRVVSVE